MTPPRCSFQFEGFAGIELAPRVDRVQSCRTGSCLVLILILAMSALPLFGREKDAASYGAGLTVNIPLPESEVEQVVEEVVQNGIIRGTKEYNKDEYVSGAVSASSTHVFKEWTEGGKVFYKVRLHALDPRNFKDSGDVGTLAVRYVLVPQGEKNTVIHIDAVFVEDFRRTAHPSNGSVEGAEYKDIHDRLDAIESMKAETVEAEQEKKEKAELGTKKQETGQSSSAPIKEAAAAAPTPTVQAPPPPAVEAAPADSNSGAAPAIDSTENGPPETLEERAKSLRLQVERRVKAPGAPLKSAPFHTASTLQSLTTGTEVLIVISTSYWLGVETHEGQHGWMLRDELEQVP